MMRLTADQERLWHHARYSGGDGWGRIRFDAMHGEGWTERRCNALLREIEAAQIVEVNRRGYTSEEWSVDALSKKDWRALHKKPSKSTGQRFLYAIQADYGPIKVGISANPKRRLATLQTASPSQLRLLATWPGSHANEEALHKALQRHRMRGEWFRPHADVLEAVAKASA